jgi:hypothetical protein
MNSRHSSRRPDWTTPPWLIEAARRVLGTIDLDPASSERSNEIVMAKKFFDEKHDGLQQPWRVSMRTPKLRGIWLNPPGGKTSTGESRSKLFWQRLIFERQVNPEFGDALFLAYSIEMAQISQVNCERSLLSFPTCFLRRRVSYFDIHTRKQVDGMTHSSSVTYIPGNLDRTKRFVEVFAEFGDVVTRLEATA